MNVKPVLSLREAVERYIPDGQEVMIGGFAFSDPTALAHELIRQHRKKLYVMKTSGGVLVDMLIGAGCVDRVLFCHIWNSVGPVPAHCFRRALEQGIPNQVAVEELSFGAFTMALLAGACDLPFMPSTPVQGAGHYTQRTFLPDKFGLVDDPFGGKATCVVRPIKPALGVFHIHRVDRLGNAQFFGPAGELRYSIAACKKVIVIAEQLVDTELIRERPEATVAPGFMVDAIVVEPWAAHPTDSYGYYYRDLQHNELYGEMTRTVEGFRQYVNEWIVGTKDHQAFIAKLGERQRTALRLRKEPW